MLKMGFNIGTSDMKRLLEENERQMSGVRSWKQLFGSAGQSYSAQNAAITGSYSDTIAQAYKANMAQNDAIMSAGLNLGATKELVENNRAALHSAYQTYIQNYEQAVSTNAQNYMATVDAYNKDLTARAENFSKLYNYAYKYLSEELANTRYAKSEGGIAEGTSWLANNQLDWLYDNELGTAVPWDRLSEQLFDRNSAELTDKGREFFDAMFNARPEGYITSGETDEWATRSFDSWLGDTDAELRDWYVQGDAYNYNKYGTNLGTAKTLLGMESTDTSYKASDYMTFDRAKNDIVALGIGDDYEKIKTEWDTINYGRAALQELKHEMDTAYKNALDGSKNATYEYTRLQTEYNNAKEKQTARERQVVSKWREVVDVAKTDFYTKLANLNKLFGSAVAEEFEVENKALIEELTEYYEFRYTDFNEKYVSEINRLQTEYNRKIEAYIKKIQSLRAGSQTGF